MSMNRMTYDKWEEQYQPLLEPEGEGSYRRFEYGDPILDLLKPEHIWTQIEGENFIPDTINGYHDTGIDFYVTKIGWDEGDNINIIDQSLPGKQDQLFWVIEPDVDMQYLYNVRQILDRVNWDLDGDEPYSQINWLDGMRRHTTLEIKEKFDDFKSLWQSFDDIPINENDEIDTDFIFFKKGTDRFEIWHWFEENFDVSIHDLIYGTDERSLA